MVEWAPVTGWLPPLSTQAWLLSFEEYQGSPEFRWVNHWMTLADYQWIYGVEYAHRLLARMLGLAAWLPLFYWAWRYRPPVGWWMRWSMFGWAVVMQGAVGWWMVASGLVHRPEVSPLRLSAHLMMATGLWLALWITLRRLTSQPTRAALTAQGLPHPATGLLWKLWMGAIMAQMCVGAWMAGTRAGYVLNSYPDFDGAWWPEGWWNPALGWANFWQNTAFLHVIHRHMAHILLLAGMGLAYHIFLRSKQEGWSRTRRHQGLKATLGFVLVQWLVGVATLVSQLWMPVALLHQWIPLGWLAYLVWLYPSILYVQAASHRGLHQTHPNKSKGAVYG
jgi:cytochrome c oxidase assembly protein subunit 15